MNINKNDYVIENAKNFFQNKITYTIGPIELEHLLNNNSEDFQVIDLRTLSDYEVSHIQTAIHLPEDDIKNNLDILDKDKFLILYCYNEFCHLSAKCAVELLNLGYKVIELEGGFKTWQKFKLPVE